MIKKGMGYFVGLVSLYIVVQHASDSGKLITNGADGFSKVTKTFQGR